MSRTVLETHRKGRNEGGKGRRRDQTIAEEGLFHPIFGPVQKEERTNTARVGEVTEKMWEWHQWFSVSGHGDWDATIFNQTGQGVWCIRGPRSAVSSQVTIRGPFLQHTTTLHLMYVYGVVVRHSLGGHGKRLSLMPFDGCPFSCLPWIPQA